MAARSHFSVRSLRYDVAIVCEVSNIIFYNLLPRLCYEAVKLELNQCWLAFAEQCAFQFMLQNF